MSDNNETRALAWLQLHASETLGVLVGTDLIEAGRLMGASLDAAEARGAAAERARIVAAIESSLDAADASALRWAIDKIRGDHAGSLNDD